MSAEGTPPLLRPKPRRPFEIGPLSSTTTSSSQPSPEPHTTSLDDEKSTTVPSRSRSILNLTSSTLAGVFGYPSDRDEPPTPWGNGTQTPIDGLRQELGDLLSNGKSMDEALMMRSRERRGSMLSQSARRSRTLHKPKKTKTIKGYWIPLFFKTAVLALIGVGYGAFIRHVHGRKQLAPVRVNGLNHESPYYLVFWAFMGTTLGWLMPYVDSIWNDENDDDEDAIGVGYKTLDNAKMPQATGRSGWTPVWNDLVRTAGVFSGIAFAIRHIPWHSTLQLALTLTLSNPTLWFLLDRSAPGFILSTTIALSGTALMLGIKPDLVPSPSLSSSLSAAVNNSAAAAQSASNADHLRSSGLVAGLFSLESVGVATWIVTVLFVACVCFGNIGRRL
ncbi:hypothetical protein AAFC00_003875 [Neodothiora populina]|uniref:Uncharacterized protein n=1 Tax=Neodothiora populina TaxID=2781224 RepID=A0ABR3PG40_9PEZI